MEVFCGQKYKKQLINQSKMKEKSIVARNVKKNKNQSIN